MTKFCWLFAATALTAQVRVSLTPIAVDAGRTDQCFSTLLRLRRSVRTRITDPQQNLWVDSGSGSRPKL
jgi:hypothetical protein